MAVFLNLDYQKIIDAISYRFDIDIIGIQATEKGISENTYQIDTANSGRLFLKIYCENSRADIQAEINILNFLYEKGLKVVEPYGSNPVFMIEHFHCCLFHSLPGKSVSISNINEIKTAARFLGELHSFSYQMELDKKNFLSKSYLNKLILFSDYKLSKREMEIISKIEDINHGIIHGDLFPDNLLFDKGELSGVMDFSSSSNGAFQFDLAVFLMSWCLNGFTEQENTIQIALTEYNRKSPLHFSLSEIIPWIEYIIVFFTVKRHYLKQIHNDSSQIEANELFKKFDNIDLLKSRSVVYEEK